MGLTIEQALQQGIAAHKEGKLEEAERLYRAILQSQPAHPDANHNLGELAVSVNKTAAALPLFKVALEANPKIEQFWLSYIDALIKEKQFENAKQVLEQAKNQGLAEEKLNVLETQLTPTAQVNEPKLAVQNKSLSLSQKRKKLAEQKKQKKAKKQNLKAISPSESEIKNLLEHYQNGRYDDAEKLAKSITQQFPEHQFAWTILGAVLKQTGRVIDSLTALRKSVKLAPQDAAAHSNLGITLQELGRLDEAEASYTQAIALKPNFAEAHYNLGITLQELGRLGEAESSYTQAIALKPDYAEAHSNLGITLQELGRLDEAEASYTQAIALKPENIKAHSRLLMCLFQQDKKSVFFDELDYLINQDKANAIIGSLACRSALKYGLEKPNSFCTKPLNYVLHNDLNTRYDFEKIFVEKAKSILNKNQISNRRQTLLVNGNQTSGNIFDIKNDDTNEIQNIIRFEVEKYQTKFKESEEGLIKKMPAEYSLHGWLISMKSGGNLKPHIHTEGWLSGSIYINVPRKLKVDSGNLVVALGKDNDTTDKRINEKKTINVVTGSMVLFPASLMHYTIPFESEEERIVLAFDVKKMIMSKNS
jgi:Flp pilus assembly protein TadD